MPSEADEDIVPIHADTMYTMRRVRWECGCTLQIEENLAGTGGGSESYLCQEHRWGIGRKRQEA